MIKRTRSLSLSRHCNSHVNTGRQAQRIPRVKSTHVSKKTKPEMTGTNFVSFFFYSTDHTKKRIQITRNLTSEKNHHPPKKNEKKSSIMDIFPRKETFLRLKLYLIFPIKDGCMTSCLWTFFGTMKCVLFKISEIKSAFIYSFFIVSILRYLFPHILIIIIIIIIIKVYWHQGLLLILFYHPSL